MPCRQCWHLGDRGSHLRLSLQRITEVTCKSWAWTLLLIAPTAATPAGLDNVVPWPTVRPGE